MGADGTRQSPNNAVGGCGGGGQWHKEVFYSNRLKLLNKTLNTTGLICAWSNLLRSSCGSGAAHLSGSCLEVRLHRHRHASLPVAPRMQHQSTLSRVLTMTDSKRGFLHTPNHRPASPPVASHIWNDAAQRTTRTRTLWRRLTLSFQF